MLTPTSMLSSNLSSVDNILSEIRDYLVNCASVKPRAITCNLSRAALASSGQVWSGEISFLLSDVSESTISQYKDLLSHFNPTDVNTTDPDNWVKINKLIDLLNVNTSSTAQFDHMRALRFNIQIKESEFPFLVNYYDQKNNHGVVNWEWYPECLKQHEQELVCSISKSIIEQDLLQSTVTNSTVTMQMNELKEMVNSVRNLRAKMGISPGTKVPLLVEATQSASVFLPYIIRLCRLSDASIVESLPTFNAPVAVVGNMRLMLHVEVDTAAERLRLNKEISKLEEEVNKLTVKLSNPSYTARAPAHIVDRDRSQLDDATAKMQKLQNQIALLV